MIDVRLILAAFALVLMFVGVAVFRRQARATSCPRHSRVAERNAVFAGWASLIGGIGLIGYVIVLNRT
jgi:type IV secretory pathway TrbD component